MERNPLYDRAKGLGMILVIYGHMFAYGGIPFSIIFSFHMPLFFIISGMLISSSKLENYSYARWIKNIIKRYIPPIVFFSLLGGIVRFLLYGVPDWKQIAIDFYLHMSSDELLTGAIWFLSMLAFVMLLIPFFIRPIIFQSGGGKIVTILSLSLMAYIISKVPLTFPFLIKTIPVALLFVYIGYIFREDILAKADSDTAMRYMLYLLPLFLMLVFLNRTVNLAVPIYNDFLVYMICALYGTIMTLQIATYKLTLFIEYIGKNSLVVFSLHSIWINIFVGLLNNNLGTSYVPMVDIPFYYVLVGGVIVTAMTVLSTVLVLPIYNSTLKALRLK